MDEIFVRCAKKENYPIDWSQSNVKFGTDGNAPVKCKRTAVVDRLINSGVLVIVVETKVIEKPIETKVSEVKTTVTTINKELTTKK